MAELKACLAEAHERAQLNTISDDLENLRKQIINIRALKELGQN